MNENNLIKRAESIASLEFQCSLNKLKGWQLGLVLGEALMEHIGPDWQRTNELRKQNKQAYYLSMEFLIGRMIFNNLYCAGVLEETDELLKAQGIDLRILEDVEDYAFGNGGLGRLAACYLDSAAAHNIPLMGYGLRYKFGLFKQSFVDARQIEQPDNWSEFGDPFSIRRYDLRLIISFGDESVMAVPYDMPIIGYEKRSVGTLRLWQTEPLQEVDFELFNAQQYEEAAAAKNKAEDLCKFLYPNDSGDEGKLLRIKQEYVLSSASVQDILRSFRTIHGNDYASLPSFAAIQLNDTHPAMAIPELIRLLEDDGVDFYTAFQIARNTFSYTNHTVMSEALEKWEARLLKQAVPQIFPIIRRINQMLLHELKRPDLSLVKNQRVNMADLSIYATHATNGVAQIHSQILKDSLFSDWYSVYPDRFTNITNGITQRRWLALCNPQLSELITKTLGHDDYIYKLETLHDGLSKIDDRLAQDFMAVKAQKKQELAKHIYKLEGIQIPPHFVFDVQIKRMHEYKRQLMNAFSVMAIYQGLKDGSITDFTPTAFIFGGKAAPGYARAKAIIYYINQMAAKINADPEMHDKLRLVFVHDYNCSYAEKIIPACDISEQISPAGTEASGTGNMKLMLNGAVTLGTFDGANVEIVEEAGLDNNYIFGATVDEIEAIKNEYDPQAIYDENEVLRKAVDTLIDGTFDDMDGDAEGTLKELYVSLLEGASWHQADHYYIFLDFQDYLRAKLLAIKGYQDSLTFAKKCLCNVFSAGKFSSDRAVMDYAKEIWKL